MNGMNEKSKGIQQSFSTYYDRYSLRFENSRMEIEYRNEAILRTCFQQRIVMICISIFQLVILIKMFVSRSFILYPSITSVALHIIGYFLFKKSLLKCAESMIAFFSLFNQITYDLIMNSIGDEDNDAYFILGEFFIAFIVCILFRTRVYSLDCLLVILTRISHAVFIVKIYTETSVIFVILIILVQMTTMCFYFFQSEQIARERFLMRTNQNQWQEIIDKVLPVNVIVSKFNQRTCEIILGKETHIFSPSFAKQGVSNRRFLGDIFTFYQLESCNEKCSKQFKIKDNETYNVMLNKIKISSFDGEGMVSLRDHVLNKHFEQAEGKNIKTPTEKEQNYFNQSMHDLDQQAKVLASLNQQSSAKRKQFASGIIDEPADGSKPFSLKSLQNIGYENQLDKYEILIGYYREKEYSSTKKYEIKIYTMREGAHSTLVLSFEDKSHTSTLKFQKDLTIDTNLVFQRTLMHFQVLVKLAMSSLNEVSSRYIPNTLLYNTLLLNMQINNIQDYLQIKQVRQIHPAHQNGGITSLGNISPIPIRTSIGRAKLPTQLSIQALDLSEMLDQLDKLMKKVCKERDINFILLNETPEDQVIVTDKNRIYRVLVNYISNSILATKKGYIQLKVSNTNNIGIPVIKFEIIDSGVGFTSTRNSNSSAQGMNTNDIKSNQAVSEDDLQYVNPTKSRKKSSIFVKPIGLQQQTSGEKQRQQQKLIPRQQNSHSLTSQSNNNNGLSGMTTANYGNTGGTVNNGISQGHSTIEDANVFIENSQAGTIMDRATVQTIPQKTGLGIGLIISKHLVSLLGPGFPKIYSRLGIGTNVTFEVYADLKVTQSHQTSSKYSLFNTPVTGVTGPSNIQQHGPSFQSKRPKNSSFNLFQSNLVPATVASPQANTQNNIQNPSSIIQFQPAQNQKENNNGMNSSGGNNSGLQSIQQQFQNMMNVSSQRQAGTVGENSDTQLLLGQSEQRSKIIHGNNNLSQQALIQLDGPENIDEDAMEYQNLGGNCYKMIVGEETRLILQKREQYLVSFGVGSAEVIESSKSNRGTFHPNQKKLSQISGGGISNTGAGSFMLIQNHSQLQPFSLSSNDNYFQPNPHFGANNSSNSRQYYNNSNQNVNNNNNSFQPTDKNGLSLSSITKQLEIKETGSPSKDQAAGYSTPKKKIKSNPVLAVSSDGLLPLFSYSQQTQGQNNKVGQNQGGQRRRDNHNIHDILNEKVFQSSPDFLDPQGFVTEGSARTFPQNPIKQSPNQPTQHDWGNSSNNSSQHQTPNNPNATLRSSSIKKMQELQIQEAVNQGSYSNRKVKNKSSFCLIFDMKSNLINDEPESTLGITALAGRSAQGELKDDASQLVETQPINQNSGVNNYVQEGQGSQRSFVTNSLSSKRKDQHEVSDEQAHEFLSSSFPDMKSRGQSEKDVQLDFKQRRISLQSPSPIPNSNSSGLFGLQIQNQQSQLQPRTTQDAQSSSGLYESGGIDHLNGLIFNPEREKSVSIKVSIRNDKVTSLVQSKEKEQNTANQSSTNRGYRISIGNANELYNI